jgi:hypothetical protein
MALEAHIFTLCFVTPRNLVGGYQRFCRRKLHFFFQLICRNKDTYLNTLIFVGVTRLVFRVFIGFRFVMLQEFVTDFRHVNV